MLAAHLGLLAIDVLTKLNRVLGMQSAFLTPATCDLLKELKDRVRSFGYAWEGIVYLVKSQHNAWIHLIVTVLAIGVGFWLGISRSDWGLLVLAMMGVWMGEAVNTAVEAIVDMVQPDFHPMAKIAKDVAAGGVLLSAVAAAIVGLLILGPPLVETIGAWLTAIS